MLVVRVAVDSTEHTAFLIVVSHRSNVAVVGGVMAVAIAVVVAQNSGALA